MPTYSYACASCGHREERLQSHAEMKRTRLACAECGQRMERVFGVPAIITDTTFTRTMDDGFGNDQIRRRMAYAAARRAGVNPNGKIYCPGLCRRGRPFDPGAWVSASHARAEIRRRCEQLNYACEGDITVKQRPSERPAPDEAPYRVADEIVQKEVAEIVQREHGGKLTPKKRQKLVEETSERLSGAQ